LWLPPLERLESSTGWTGIGQACEISVVSALD